MSTFVDLIYGERKLANLITAKFPDAEIEDATDIVHDERFSVTLPADDKHEYLKLVIEKGLGTLSLTLQMMMNSDIDEVTMLLHELKKEGK